MRASIAITAGLVAVASAKTTTVTETADVTVTSCEPSVTNCPYKPGSTAVDPDHTWVDWTSSTTTTTTTKKADPTTVDPDHTWVDWTSSTTTTKKADPTTVDPDHTWYDWTSTTSKPVDPTTTDHTWADWTTTTPVAVTTSVACGKYTATAPPAWFSLLPTDVYSSVSAKWTGVPPADWCYYTYSTSSLVYATPTTAVTPYWPGKSSTPVAPASSGTGVWTYSSTPVAPQVATYTGAASANAGSLALAGLAAAAALVIA